MLSRVLSWLLKKLSGVILIVALGVAGLGLWLYMSDTLGFEERKAELARLFTGERDRLLEAKSAQAVRQKEMERELAGERDRVAQASRAMRALGELGSTWDKLFGDREAQRQYARRLEHLRAQQEQAKKRVQGLEEGLRIESYTREGLEIALGRTEKRIEQAKATESKALLYGRRAWDKYKVQVLIALAGWLLGPIAWKLSLFFIVAPLVGRGRPLHFSPEAKPLPEVMPSRVALELSLDEGEWMRVKEPFLQASDEVLRKRTRWLFDWSMPFTSMACGLTEMIELRHPGSSQVQARVTLSCSSDPLAELALIHIPEGGSLILSPRYIAALIKRDGSSAKIRRRWVILRWQSWVSLQFRYFEFQGPMQLVLSGARGIRVEDLSGRGGMAARRVNHNAIIGFTPDLRYTPARAETFWAYYRGMNPLFDDLFSGEGLFLCQASARPEETKGERFWSSLWAGVLRVFGV